ncbi:3353_t:CDS:2 [Paraglomus brasilianum]|uniref:3353_t:CDS:1 n=1 Tax=Paraglomus brasilianum TaxID=144538 RepID=A0A9N9D4F7_9GLOM|nr:3353_t:CDS:2 [Paraglomus brasilianum]
MSFEQLGIDGWLVEALRAMSIKYPTEIQSACIPPILAGRNCIGGANTGSGKTLAFALPILQKLSEDPYGIFALVLTPTRELAFQIADQFRVLGKTTNLKECIVVGGMNMIEQAIELSRRPHVVISTPGRLVDHIRNSSDSVYLKKIRFLILDEADRLLSPTFSNDLSIIFDNVPTTRQTLLFTATMTDSILALGSEEDETKKPFVHQVNSNMSTVSSLTQYYVFIPSHVREPYLVYLLNREELNGKSTIIFCGRCRTAELLRVMLSKLDIRCASLHSVMSQKERLNSLGKFRAEAVKVLIATDVGSRGLDIPTVQLVINYNIPSDSTDYIHRVGRAARAGRDGTSISFVTEQDIELVHKIESRITDKKMDEWEVNENKVLDMLNKVADAKRAATMHLHDSHFGSAKEIQKKKHRLLNGTVAKKNVGSRRKKIRDEKDNKVSS